MNSLPKVLMVTGTYLPRINGAVLQCAGLIERLSDRVSFQVLTSGDVPTLAGEASGKRTAIKVHRLVRTESLALKVHSAFKIMRLLASERFDVIHLHGFSSKALVIAAIAKLFGSRVVLKCTSLGVDDARSLAARGWVHRRFLAMVDTLICPSPAFLTAGLGAKLPADRMVPIPNFVDATRFRPGTPEERMAKRAELKLKPTDLAILFVGHFSRDKRPDFLFNALGDTLASNPNIQLIMIGEATSDLFEVDPALYASIKDKAAALGVQDQVRWIRQHQRIEDVYMAVDVFIMPSIREGMPNALAEAMCVELPVVATLLRGVTDWMLEGGKCGRLFPVDGKPSELAASIVDLLKSASTRQSLGAYARRRCIDHFSPNDVCEKVHQLYQSLNNSPTS